MAVRSSILAIGLALTVLPALPAGAYTLPYSVECGADGQCRMISTLPYDAGSDRGILGQLQSDGTILGKTGTVYSRDGLPVPGAGDTSYADQPYNPLVPDGIAGRVPQSRQTVISGAQSTCSPAVVQRIQDRQYAGQLSAIDRADQVIDAPEPVKRISSTLESCLNNLMNLGGRLSFGLGILDFSNIGGLICNAIETQVNSAMTSIENKVDRAIPFGNGGLSIYQRGGQGMDFSVDIYRTPIGSTYQIPGLNGRGGQRGAPVSIPGDVWDSVRKIIQ